MPVMEKLEEKEVCRGEIADTEYPIVLPVSFLNPA